MSHSAWEHCHEGFVGVDKYQHVLKDSQKKINKKCTDAETSITKIKTPEDKSSKRKRVFVEKYKGNDIHSAALKKEQNDFMSGFEEFFQSSNDFHQSDNIEWSDSSSSEDNLEPIHYIGQKNALKFKRRCLGKKNLSSHSKSAAFLKNISKTNIDNTVKLEMISFENNSSTTPPKVKFDHFKSVGVPLDHSLISNSESHKQPDELKTFSHANVFKKMLCNRNHDLNDLKISGTKKLNDFKNYPDDNQELLESILDVASETENESEKDNCCFQEDESSNNETNAENPHEVDSLENTDISRFSSNNSTQSETIRASDWILAGQKQKTPVKMETSLSEQGQDSAKKKKKYEKGTLAGRMHQLLNWEKSSIRFWYHSVSSGFSDVSERKSTVLKIIAMKYQFSVYISKCLIIDTQELCKAIISKDTVDKLTLRPSMTVQIFPPWQELKERNGSKILLCTNFVKVVPTLTTSDGSGTNKEVIRKECITSVWDCPCLSDMHLSCTDCPACKYPVSPHFHPMENATSYENARLQLVAKTSPGSKKKRTLLESMEGIRSDQDLIPTFVARVLRVFNYMETNKLRRQLLVEDEVGSMILIMVPSKHLAVENIYKLEKQILAFSGFCLVSRMDRDRHPDLFSLVDLVHINSHSESQQMATDSPNYAFMLESPDGKDTQFHIEAIEELEANKSLQLTELSAVHQISRNCRISFVAKLVYGRLKNGNSQKMYVFDGSCNKGRQTILISLDVSNNCILDTDLSSALFRDVRCEQGVLYADIYTGVFSPTSCTLWNINIGSSDWGRVESSKLCLPTLTPESLPGSFVTLQGIISSIDDSTAYTWEECDMCGSDQLATLPDTGSIICIACNRKVEVPKLKMKMEANVHIPSAHLTVKIDLSQKTIKSVLPTDVDDEGYDIDQVINHSVNCPVCLVQELLSDNKRRPKFSLLELNYNIT